MGYTHYWYREKEIPHSVFTKIVADFRKMVTIMEHAGLRLAGPYGNGRPEISEKLVAFNGCRKCGNAKVSVTIPWPDENAKGISFDGDARVGEWVAGDILSSRTCDGEDCSYEGFYFPRVITKRKPEDRVLYYDENWNPVYNDPEVVGKYFDFCKTAYRPYDFAVNVFLIIAKHYLGDRIIVRSDGTIKQWEDAIDMVQHFLGYGDDFELD